MKYLKHRNDFLIKETKLTQVEVRQQFKNSAIINEALEKLDSGTIRVCEKKNNDWHTYQWIKKAILLSFKITATKAVNNQNDTLTITKKTIIKTYKFLQMTNMFKKLNLIKIY